MKSGRGAICEGDFREQTECARCEEPPPQALLGFGDLVAHHRSGGKGAPLGWDSGSLGLEPGKQVGIGPWREIRFGDRGVDCIQCTALAIGILVQSRSLRLDTAGDLSGWFLRG
jgi:hypothetical protein